MTLTATARPTGYPGYTETTPCEPENAQAARSLVRTALDTWGLGHLADDGALVVSELFGNAVRHTRSRYVLVTITRPTEAFVRVAVVDKSRVLPHPPPPGDGDGDEHGRGLTVVEAVCDRWGVDRLGWGGKRVWGELRCGGAR